MTDQRRRYVLVGSGHRARMFVDALTGSHRDVAELVAICDMNETRMRHYADQVAQAGDTEPRTYGPTDFAQMLESEQPDAVIVTTIDRTHDRYITQAMRAGCDAITEKPMTTDAVKCQSILDAMHDTGRHVTVTFNYRYRPSNAQVKELLAAGEIGQVQAVHFEWMLDTKHGADYFRRWHRDKRNSGGLLVHKSTHHFDLVNWWLDARPEVVFAQGDLRFYGRANAEDRGEWRTYARGTSPEAAADPFALDLAAHPDLDKLYLQAESEDGYLRDQNVFGDGISIEDTMAVLVRYDTGALMTYSLTAYNPWEGYRIAFTGTRGRLEMEVAERAFVPASDATVDPSYAPAEPADVERSAALRPTRILLQRQWEPVTEISVADGEGGHGGGDARLLDHVFRGAGDDPLGQSAGPIDGAQSVLTGVAANRSIATGLPVQAQGLLSW